MSEIPIPQAGIQEFIAAPAKNNRLRLKERELLRALHAGRTDVNFLQTKSRARRERLREQGRHPENIVWKTKLKEQRKQDNGHQDNQSMPVQVSPPNSSDTDRSTQTEA